ncbi:MAG: alpha/beta hydrolase-fold protein [Gemmatimonadaceae bacterium]
MPGRRHPRWLLSAAALWMLAPAAAAQGKSEPIVIGTKTTLRSKVLKESRPVWIHVPAGYDKLPGQRFPVIYLLDGDEHFTELTGIVQRLAGNGRMPDAIIVALPNTTDRTFDLTPPAASDSSRFPWYRGARDSVAQRFKTRGGADRFLSFITTELTPWVDAKYRTAPYRILIGHSFGGLFVLNALAREPGSFRSYVALSPSLWWDDGRYLATLEQQLAHASLAGRSLYMTTGGSELEGEMIAPARALAANLATGQVPGFQSWYRVMPGEEHNTNPHRSTYDALETIFSGWAAHDSLFLRLAATGDSMPLVAHFAALSKRVGFEVPVPVAAVNDLGHFILQLGRVDDALRLFRFSAAHSPGVASVHDALADGLESAGRRDDAMRAMEEAVRLADAAHDASAAGYRKRLARLRRGR